MREESIINQTFPRRAIATHEKTVGQRKNVRPFGLDEHLRAAQKTQHLRNRGA